MAPLKPTCISVSPTGSITLVSSLREISHYLHLKPSTWGNQRGARSHKLIFGTVFEDSSLQDRGVAHYLLSLLFSLVSSTFSFYLCVPYQKSQENKLTCLLQLIWVPQKPPSFVPSLVTKTIILSAPLLPHLPLQHL